MKQKHFDEFDNFDKVMDGLLSVPYKELQQKLEEEKREKERKKQERATSSSPVSPSSSNAKRRGR